MKYSQRVMTAAFALVLGTSVTTLLPTGAEATTLLPTGAMAAPCTANVTALRPATTTLSATVHTGVRTIFVPNPCGFAPGRVEYRKWVNGVEYRTQCVGTGWDAKCKRPYWSCTWVRVT